jgi:catechol 2,3-dioxygenase-like lactoylglutathione lyase family enzyme
MLILPEATSAPILRSYFFGHRLALCVKDIKATADFYVKAFGLKRTEIKEGKTAWNCYLSDGEVNLALLQYKGETGSGVPKGWVGIHHFGFQCDDLPA